MKPYINLEETDKYIVREFDQTINPSELIWHRDRENRTIIPLEQNDWMIQLDNQLPQPIDKDIFIPKEEIHRVIKGTGKLLVKIIKE